ncbi:MAG: glycosyltransferase family 4 protein [Legionellales bacterium]|nr:glycosyltransferase family 4 protein [Legionellales bacterium]
MKVLMYGWEFPPNINGGLGIACYGIVQALLRQNLQIGLVLPRAKKTNGSLEIVDLASEPENQADNLTLYYIDSIIKPYLNEQTYSQELKANPMANQFYGNDLAAEVRRYAAKAGQLAKTIPHDVIHAHDWLTILAGIEAKKISQKPLFFHVHALEIDRSGGQINQAIFDIEKQGLYAADKIFAVSKLTRQNIINQYHIAPEKIEVIYNGLSESYIQRPYEEEDNKQNIVLFLGRITYQKGPFYFLDVAHKILSKRQDIQFAMAGDGDLLRSVIEYAAKLRIGSHVHFLGFLDRNQVKDAYEHSKVYVMPSISEPFGLSCLEALALNVPVVISKQSGAAEVLQHVFKVDFWDVDLMAEKIMALIDFPKLRKELVQNSQPELTVLNWDNSVKGIIKSYQSQISN